MDDRLLVPGKQVVFESGETRWCPAFVIAKNTVSVGDFAKFARATGFRTLAELEGNNTYFENGALLLLEEEARLKLPAMCICYLDACKYCEWRNARLPTETEWLSMAVCIEERLSNAEARRRFVRNGRWYLDEISGGLQLDSAELTSTEIDENYVVVRAGPKYYRPDDFEARVRQNRSSVRKTTGQLMLTFRLVWDCPQETQV